MALNEFKPPSDFVSNDGGGSGKSWLKWLGIGCGVIVLVIGVLLAVGTWKTASCCGELYDQARRSAEATQFSIGFAEDLAQGKLAKARAKMSEDLNAQVSAEQLQDTLASYQGFLSAGPSRVSDISVEKNDLDEPMRWMMTVDFASPAGDEKLVAMIELVSHGEGDEATFLVDGLEFETRARDIGAEPPAVEVLDFHRQLRGGNYESAYRHMSSEFTQQNNLDVFRTFVREQQEVFRTGTIEVLSIDYTSQSNARVLAVLESGGERVEVIYELVRPMQHMPKWLIDSVQPNYDVAVPQPHLTDTDAGVETDARPVDEGAPEGDAGPAER